MAGGGLSSSVSKKEYNGNLTCYVLLTCLVTGFGGIMFGYDIGISGGVTSMPAFLEKFFPSVYHQEEMVQSNSQYCKFNSQSLTMFTSSLYLAALVASFVAARVTKSLGRRWSMLLGGTIFLCGALLNAAAIHVSMLILGRVLLGIGVGFSIQSIPLYVSEMAPYKHRGALNSIFQLSITIGILIANLVNFFSSKYIKGDNAWRVSLGGAAVPALIITLSGFFVCETPNSLIEREEYAKARQQLRRIRGVYDVDAEFDDLMAASLVSKSMTGSPWASLLKRKYRPQLVLAVLIPMFQQLTGINVVMFYAPELFSSLGSGQNVALMSAVVTGIVNVASTFIAVFGLDKFGRRRLFQVGGIIMLIFQASVAGLIGAKFGWTGVSETPMTKLYSIILLTCICCFVSAFAFSWAPLGWLVPSEIFPLEIRSSGQAVVAAVNMLLTFAVAQAFLTSLCHLKYGLFAMFAVIVLVMTLFVQFFVPETKDIPIEETWKLWRKHWYWKKFVQEDHHHDHDHHRAVDHFGRFPN
ncbi:sugar transport protein 12-like [Impatiens glandulifera]|uniref:sugar transport protein 12-like n=1 Tax=Impatiens glandulifera TaxID=253017 RepID=UPI001FB13515|nr:sugar transport protein 12-like [Impatiens glandulifera]